MNGGYYVPQIIRDAVSRVDGSIQSHSGGEFFRYFGGDRTMQLDGDFTAAELRALADHIDKYQKQETTK